MKLASLIWKPESRILMTDKLLSMTLLYMSMGHWRPSRPKTRIWRGAPDGTTYALRAYQNQQTFQTWKSMSRACSKNCSRKPCLCSWSSGPTVPSGRDRNPVPRYVPSWRESSTTGIETLSSALPVNMVNSGTKTTSFPSTRISPRLSRPPDASSSPQRNFSSKQN